MLWSITAYTEMGKAMDQVAKVARDLIKARRESGHTEKVYSAPRKESRF